MGEKKTSLTITKLEDKQLEFEEEAMDAIKFLDSTGTFSMKQPENYNYLYFPIAGEQGMKGAVSPNLGGDIKVDQN